MAATRHSRVLSRNERACPSAADAERGEEAARTIVPEALRPRGYSARAWHLLFGSHSKNRMRFLLAVNAPGGKAAVRMSAQPGEGGGGLVPAPRFTLLGLVTPEHPETARDGAAKRLKSRAPSACGTWKIRKSCSAHVTPELTTAHTFPRADNRGLSLSVNRVEV